MASFDTVLRLAELLRPTKDVTQTEWFVKAKRSMDEVREIMEKRRQEKEAAQKRTDEEYLAMISEDLAKIRAEKQKGCVRFLRFVNEKYAPANK